MNERLQAFAERIVKGERLTVMNMAGMGGTISVLICTGAVGERGWEGPEAEYKAALTDARARLGIPEPPPPAPAKPKRTRKR